MYVFVCLLLNVSASSTDLSCIGGRYTYSYLHSQRVDAEMVSDFIASYFYLPAFYKCQLASHR